MKVIPAGLSDHELIGCTRKLNNVNFDPRIIICQNFANYDLKLFCEDLNAANLEEVYLSIIVNDKKKPYIIRHHTGRQDVQNLCTLEPSNLE